MFRASANQMDRRAFLRVGGGATLLAVAGTTLSGCGSKSDKAGGTNASTAKMPTYRAAPSAAKPDLAGNGSSVEPGYLKFPAKVTNSVPAKPGKGNTYNACVLVFGPPVSDNNPQIQAVDTALGAHLKYQQIPQDQYNAKVTAMLAGGSIPDLLAVPSWDLPARLVEGGKHVFADLGSYLSGDAILKYPNLAAIPSAAWVGAVIDGAIRGVPIQAPQISWATFMRTDLLEKAGQSMPTSVDEMLKVAKAMTNASKNRWAWWDPDQFVRRTYGLSNVWQKDDQGTLRYYWEMPAWTDALNLYQRLFKAGVMHPNALNASADKKAPFLAGQTVFVDDGFDAWRDWASPVAAKTNKADFKVDPLVPFGADGKETTVWCDYPWLTTTFFSAKLSPAQIEELLGILNFLAAPYGTKENLLVQMGVEGRHWTMKNGIPTPTKLATEELRTQYYFTAQPARTTVNFREPEWVRRVHTWQSKVAPMAKVSPAAGLLVNTPPRLQAFTTKPLDAQKEFVRGRISADEYKGVITAWQKQYGDPLRKLVQQAVDASK